MAGSAELAHKEDVEGCVKRLCDFEGDWDTAPRQRQDDDIITIGVRGQCPCKALPGFSSVAKYCGQNGSAPLG
jgi:hypothetical protein